MAEYDPALDGFGATPLMPTPSPDPYGASGYDLQAMLPPVPQVGPQFAMMGGMSPAQMIAAMQAQRQQQPMPEPEAPLDLRVPEDQFIDLPTYQQTMPNLSPGEAYDEYLNTALPHQLQAMGMSPADQQQTLQNFRTSVPRPEEAGFLRRAGDVGLSLLKGVIDVPSTAVGLLDIPTMGMAGRLAEGLGIRFKDAQAFLDSMMSPEQQAAEANVAKAQGFFPTIEAMIRNPSTILQGAARSLPSMGAGGVVARGARAALPGLGAVAAGALGEGVTSAGQNIEQVRQESPTGMLTPEQIAVLSASGALTGGLSLGAGRVAQRMGLADINTLLAGGGAGTARRGLGRVGGIAGGVVEEGLLEEAPQSAQEQIAQNIAQGKPWDQGVGAAAAQGALVGGLFGGGVNVLAGSAAAPVQPPAAEVPPPGLEAPLPAEAGLAARQAALQRATAETTEPVTQEEKDFDTYERLHAEGLEALLQERGISTTSAATQRILAAFGENSDDPTTALDAAVATTRNQRLADALNDIREQVQREERLQKQQPSEISPETYSQPVEVVANPSPDGGFALRRGEEMLGGSYPLQESAQVAANRLNGAMRIRTAPTVTTQAGQTANAAAWAANFAQVEAADEQQKQVEFARMEAERQQTLARSQRRTAAQAAATGTAPAVVPLGTAELTESASRIDDALGSLAPTQQTAIRQRANQLLQETVNAANQRADQRGNAGDTRAQRGAPGRPDLGAGRGGGGGNVAAGGAGTAGLAGLTPEQRAATERARGGVGGTLADRIIAQVASGQANPDVLGLLLVAEQVTHEIVAEAQTAAPAVATAPPANAAPAGVPAPPATLKRGAAANLSIVDMLERTPPRPPKLKAKKATKPQQAALVDAQIRLHYGLPAAGRAPVETAIDRMIGWAAAGHIPFPTVVKHLQAAVQALPGGVDAVRTALTGQPVPGLAGNVAAVTAAGPPGQSPVRPTLQLTTQERKIVNGVPKPFRENVMGALRGMREDVRNGVLTPEASLKRLMAATRVLSKVSGSPALAALTPRQTLRQGPTQKVTRPAAATLARGAAATEAPGYRAAKPGLFPYEYRDLFAQLPRIRALVDSGDMPMKQALQLLRASKDYAPQRARIDAAIAREDMRRREAVDRRVGLKRVASVPTEVINAQQAGETPAGAVEPEPPIPATNRLLPDAAAAPAARARRGGEARAEPAGAVRGASDQEVAASRGSAVPVARRGAGNLRRGEPVAAVEPKRTRRNRQAAAPDLTARKEAAVKGLMKEGVARADAQREVENWNAEFWDPSTDTSEFSMAGPATGGLSRNLRQLLGMAVLGPDRMRAQTAAVVSELERLAPTDFARGIVARLQKIGLNLPIRLQDLSTETSKDGQPVRALYRRTAIGDMVLIDPRTATDDDVLHELVHAATISKMQNPTTPAEIAAAERITELYNYARSQLQTEIAREGTATGQYYGLNSVEEFVAEAFSNPEFQQTLQSMTLPGRPQISLLSAFKHWVARLLGMDTVLGHTLSAAEDLFGVYAGKPGADVAAKGSRAKQNSDAFAGRPSSSIVGVDSALARRAIAYLQKDGTYNYYDASDAIPAGIPGSNVKGLTRQEVERRLQDAKLAMVAPRTDAEAPSTTPPAASDKVLPGYRDGRLQVIAYEQDDGTWNVYTSTTDNVTTDPQAALNNVADRAAVQAVLGQGGYRTRAPSPAANVATGGGGGSNTPNQTGGSATLTPGGPAKDLTFRPPSKLRVALQDRFAPIQALGQQMAAHFERYNAALPDWARVDWHATLRNSHAKRRLDGFVQKHVEPIRQQAAALMSKYGKSQQQIEDDWINLHYEERSERKERSLDPDYDWTTPEGQAYKDRLEKQKLAAQRANTELQRLSPAYFTDLQQLAVRSKQMSDATIDLSVEYGLLAQDDADNIKAAYKYYVPIQTGERTRSGKPASGSSATGEKPFQRMQEQILHTVMRGEQNAIRQRVYQMVDELAAVRDENGKNLIELGGDLKVKVDPRDFTVGFKEDVVSPLAPDAVAVFFNGKRSYMRVGEPSLLQALTMFSGAQKQTGVTSAIGMMAWVNHLSAMGKTAANPGFAMFNLMRDAGWTMVALPKEYSRGRFAVHFASPSVWGSAFKNAFADAFGKETTGLYKQVQEAGGLITAQAYMGMDPLIAEINGKFNPGVGSKLKAGLKHPSDTRIAKFMTAFSQAMESTTRLAIYNTALEKHLNDGMAQEGAKLRAAVAAKKTTLNFEQRGALALSPFYLFANAKIQGLTAFRDKLILEKNPYSQMATVGVLSLGLLAAALGYRDSDKDKDGTSKYGKIPQNKRDTMIVFKEGAVGAPLPQELSAFYALGNTIGDLLWGDTEAKTNRWVPRVLRIVANALSPTNVPQQDLGGFRSNPADYFMRMVVPSIFMPLYDLGGNKNTFGSEIVANKEKRLAQGMPLREMYSKNESTLAVNAAKAIHETVGFDVAPAQLKYLATMFDPTASSFWIDMLGSDKPISYPGQVRNPLVRRYTADATSFADDENYNIAKQETLEAKYFVANPQALRRGTPAPDQARLAYLQQIFANTDKQIATIYKDFKQRPQASDLQINTLKQQLQQQALRQYYTATRGGG